MIWLLVDSSGLGGIETHVATLARALRDRQQPARIVLLDDHGDNPWLAQLDRRRLDRLTLSGGFFGLLAALREHRPSVLHTHGYKAGILGRLAARLAGVPVLSSFHAGERGAFPVSLYQSLDAWTSFLGARIAVSEGIARTLPFKTPVIRNFILPERETPGEPAPKRVAFVGRLSREKGPDLFCRIAAHSDPGIVFDVYGDGPMREELQALYGRRVNFHGLQSDMQAVWPQVGLLLMPSRAEGLPMAALEALAAGVPVAAAKVGALPDCVGGNGWLFEPEDCVAAVAAVAAWHALPDMSVQAIRARCRRMAVQNYGPETPVATLLDMYAGLRAQSSRGSTTITVQSSAGSRPVC